MWSLDWIAQQVGGKLLDPDTGSITVDGNVDFDSRALKSGGLYVSRVGESTDGNRFLPAAAKNGAVAALIDERPESAAAAKAAGLAAIQVTDPTIALGLFARAHLRALRWQAQAEERPEPLVVAITGSVGKTTTKDLIARLLGEMGEVIAPRGSYNNETGLPVTVLQATKNTTALVLEMGASGPGQLSYLAALTGIDIALELIVGHAHMGGFGSAEGLAKAKAEMLFGLRNFDGEIIAAKPVPPTVNPLWEALCQCNENTTFGPAVNFDPHGQTLPNSAPGTVLSDPKPQRRSQVILNAGDTYVRKMAYGDQVSYFGIIQETGTSQNLLDGDFVVLQELVEELAAEVAQKTGRSWNGEKVDIRLAAGARNVELSSTGCARFDLELDGNSYPVELGLFGEHQVYNALAAAAVAHQAGLAAPTIAALLTGQSADSPHRLRVKDGPKGSRFIDDSYNANLDSMKAGLDVLGFLGNQAPRKIAVLGQMLELGEYTENHHRQIGDKAAEVGVDLLIGVGENTRYLLESYLVAGKNQQIPAICGNGTVNAPIEVEGRKAWQVSEASAAINILEELLSTGDVVLLKGSSGSNVWQVADHFLTEN